MRKIVLIFCVFAFSIAMPIGAQIRFTAQVSSTSGDCNSLGAKVWVGVAKSSAEHISTVSFADCAECEQYRIYWISEWSGSYDGCVVRVTASPCTPCDKSNANGINILGPQQGASFYSTNPANEVADWVNDDIERQLALNKNYLKGGKENSEYSKAKQGLRNNDSWFLDTDKPFEAINYRPGGTFYTGTDDLKRIDIIFKPIDNNYSETSSNSGFLSNTIKSLDDKLDWYKAIEEGNGNLFQYMYTKWGKDNVIEAKDWWERNGMGDAFSNLINNAMNIISNPRDFSLEKMKESWVDILRFITPDRYENVLKTAETEMSIFQDVKQYLYTSPDMISNNKAPDFESVLKRSQDKTMALAEDVSNIPVMKDVYSKLKKAEDISKLPDEQQKNEAVKMVINDAKDVSKSMIKETETYKKWNDKAKKAIREIKPFEIIFD